MSNSGSFVSRANRVRHKRLTTKAGYRRARRSGATIVESALLLPVLTLTLFSMLDLGLAAMRYNALAEASRRIAREAIMHGSLAPETSSIWGPTAYSGTVADTSDVVVPARGMLPTMAETQVSVQVTWPDSDNSPRDRVQVELAYEHRSLVPGLFPWGPFDLRSVATMHIVN